MKFLSILPVAAFPLIAAFGKAQDSSTMETGIPGPIADGAHSSPAPKPQPIRFEAIRTLTKRVHVVESPEMPGLPAPEGTINYWRKGR